MPATKRHISWLAILWAGLLSGLLFLILLMLLQPFVGRSPFEVLRMIAAVVLGSSVFSSPVTFEVGTFVAAMAVHFPLAIIYTAPVGLLVRRMPVERAVAVGAGYGAALYAVNVYVFSGLFPWLVADRTPVTAIAHIVFGTLAAYFYGVFADILAKSSALSGHA